MKGHTSLTSNYQNGLAVLRQGTQGWNAHCMYEDEEGQQIKTIWSIFLPSNQTLVDAVHFLWQVKQMPAYTRGVNFGGINSMEFIVIPNITSEVDGITLYCGIDINKTFHRIDLRLYRKLVIIASMYQYDYIILIGLPIMYPFRTFTRLSAPEILSPELQINMVRILGYPYPDSFFWSLNGIQQTNDSRRKLGYPKIAISYITLSDNGIWNLTVADIETMEVVHGSFELKVFCKQLDRTLLLEL